MFGMGTGGSLRLLSPETRCASAFCCRLSRIAARQSNCLASSYLLLGFSFRFPHPQNRTGRSSAHRLTKATHSLLRNFLLSSTNHWLLDQALDRLVSSSSIRYRTSTDDLSTLSSSRGLTCFCSGNSILQGGFTLRCLQRLSRPHFASQLCRWHDNCCTRGASIPVLSY